MNKNDSDFKKKVWEFLDNIKPGVYHDINTLCIPENKTKFISSVKSYMDAKIWQGWLSFNIDFTKLYKTDEITFKKEKDGNNNFK